MVAYENVCTIKTNKKHIGFRKFNIKAALETTIFLNPHCRKTLKEKNIINRKNLY